MKSIIVVEAAKGVDHLRQAEYTACRIATDRASWKAEYNANGNAIATEGAKILSVQKHLISHSFWKPYSRRPFRSIEVQS